MINLFDIKCIVFTIKMWAILPTAKCGCYIGPWQDSFYYDHLVIFIKNDTFYSKEFQSLYNRFIEKVRRFNTLSVKQPIIDNNRPIEWVITDDEMRIFDYCSRYKENEEYISSIEDIKIIDLNLENKEYYLNNKYKVDLEADNELSNFICELNLYNKIWESFYVIFSRLMSWETDFDKIYMDIDKLIDEEFLIRKQLKDFFQITNDGNEYTVQWNSIDSENKIFFSVNDV